MLLILQLQNLAEIGYSSENVGDIFSPVVAFEVLEVLWDLMVQSDLGRLRFIQGQLPDSQGSGLVISELDVFDDVGTMLVKEVLECNILMVGNTIDEVLDQ